MASISPIKALVKCESNKKSCDYQTLKSQWHPLNMSSVK